MKKLSNEQIRLLIAVILSAAVTVLCLIGAACVQQTRPGFAMVFIFVFIFMQRETRWFVQDLWKLCREERRKPMKGFGLRHQFL